MTKSRSGPGDDRQHRLDNLFERASRQYDQGHLRSAFRLFLAAAKEGDIGSQLNLGNFYSDGIGVKPNRTSALYWYRRAYRRGYGAAASNIGVMYRNENKLTRALAWFQRAAHLKDADANLEIAKIYLQRNDRSEAVHYLRQVDKAKHGEVTEASREEARSLLNRLER